MEEIKVGEWARLDDGTIGRYIIQQHINYIKTNNQYIGFNIEKDIVKHSPKLFDLIEVGDYVNGYLINYIPTNEKAIYHDAADCEDVRCFTNETIKSIVTKEQFANIEYRIGENNE